MKPQVLIDQDQVIVQTVPALLREIKQRTNITIHQGQITQYDIFKQFNIDSSLAPKIFCSDFFRDLEPLPQAQNVTKKLSKNFDLIVATAGPECDGKKLSAKLNYPHFKDIIFEGNKENLPGDILIDDSTENLRKFMATGRPVICFDYMGLYLYNKDFREDNINSFRAKSWLEVDSILNNLFSKQVNVA